MDKADKFNRMQACNRVLVQMDRAYHRFTGVPNDEHEEELRGLITEYAQAVKNLEAEIECKPEEEQTVHSEVIGVPIREAEEE